MDNDKYSNAESETQRGNDDGVSVVKYSDKSLVVRGDRTTWGKKINAFGGRWNARLKGGAGWLISKEKLADLEILFKRKFRLDDDNDTMVLRNTQEEKVPMRSSRDSRRNQGNDRDDSRDRAESRDPLRSSRESRRGDNRDDERDSRRSERRDGRDERDERDIKRNEQIEFKDLRKDEERTPMRSSKDLLREMESKKSLENRDSKLSRKYELNRDGRNGRDEEDRYRNASRYSSDSDRDDRRDDRKEDFKGNDSRRGESRRTDSSRDAPGRKYDDTDDTDDDRKSDRGRYSRDDDSSDSDDDRYGSGKRYSSRDQDSDDELISRREDRPDKVMDDRKRELKELNTEIESDNEDSVSLSRRMRYLMNKLKAIESNRKTA